MDIFRLNLCTPLRHPVRSKTKTKGVLYAQAQPEKVRILVSLRDEKKIQVTPTKDKRIFVPQGFFEFSDQHPCFVFSF